MSHLNTDHTCDSPEIRKIFQLHYGTVNQSPSQQICQCLAAGGIALCLHAVQQCGCKGTCIVQADSVSDSDSRNKNEEIIPVNRLTQTVCADPPLPATTVRTRTVKQRTFLALTLGIRT